jgi:hypothetical protein
VKFWQAELHALLDDIRKFDGVHQRSRQSYPAEALAFAEDLQAGAAGFREERKSGNFYLLIGI